MAKKFFMVVSFFTRYMVDLAVYLGATKEIAEEELKVIHFILNIIFLTFIIFKCFTKLLKSSEDNSCWLFAISVFCLNSLVLDCVSPTLWLILQKKEKEFFVTSLQKALCFIFCKLRCTLAFSIFFWNYEYYLNII